MKKIVQLNVVCNGSTGKIMQGIARIVNKQGNESYCFYGRGNAAEDLNCFKIDNKLSILFHVFLARIGFNGHGSYFATKKLVKKLKKINPDVIHLHNIHGYWLNLKVLFNYLKNEYKGKIIWTLHDCWAFTGHCSYFSVVKCQKWIQQCQNCPQLNAYPKEFFDTTKREYKLKKRLFTALENLIIITPSVWLSNIAKRSFLGKYEIKVVNNGINLNVFKETLNESIYDKYNIDKNKKIILGVANIWEERKGLNDFIELSKLIDNKYQIVLVGVSNKIKKILPSNIVAVERTENQAELVMFYSIAHVFFNPTYEDNYPTVNLEAIACGTPVITYDVGGSKESMKDYGIVISKKDFKKMLEFCDNCEKINKFRNYNEINENIKFKEYTKYY